jgi:hypothetical protein
MRARAQRSVHDRRNRLQHCSTSRKRLRAIALVREAENVGATVGILFIRYIVGKTMAGRDMRTLVTVDDARRGGRMGPAPARIEFALGQVSPPSACVNLA